jgi:hypothetical protein
MAFSQDMYWRQTEQMRESWYTWMGLEQQRAAMSSRRFRGSLLQLGFSLLGFYFYATSLVEVGGRFTVYIFFCDSLVLVGGLFIIAFWSMELSFLIGDGRTSSFLLEERWGQSPLRGV